MSLYVLDTDTLTLLLHGHPNICEEAVSRLDRVGENLDLSAGVFFLAKFRA